MLFKLLPKYSTIKYSCVYVKSVNTPKPRGKFMIVPTPIGNLRDLSPKVLKALYSADLIGCEDRRVAGQLYHLIRSKNIIKDTQQSFGSLGLTNLVEVDPEQQQMEQNAHQFYNFANMSEKERRKFLRKMSQEEQQHFRVEFLKYRALKILNKENQWGFAGTADKLDQLYGIDISDLKHIQTQIMNCRKRKGRGLLIPLNTYNETKMYDMVKALLQTKNVALVSDAGMPCISDPGWKLVDKLRETMPDVPIQVIGGPSSVAILTLQASLCSKGNTLSGRFQGFSSLATGNYEQKNIELHNIKMKQFSINFINANKLKARLLDLQKKFGGDHQILLNNELTKRYERRFQGSISQMINKLDDPNFKPVGEISYLLYPSEEQIQETTQEPVQQQVKPKQTAIDTQELEQKLYSSVAVDIRQFMKNLQENAVKMSSREKCDFICTIFGIKKGEARKYVYDQFSKNQN